MSFSCLTEVTTVTPKDIACRSQYVVRPRVYVSWYHLGRLLGDCLSVSHANVLSCPGISGASGYVARLLWLRRWISCLSARRRLISSELDVR